MNTERDRKQMAAILVSLCGLLLVGAVILFILAALRPISFGEVTDGKYKKAVYITSNWEGVSDKDVRDEVKRLNKASFTKYNKNLGSTARQTYTFSDKNRDILFQVTDVGNRNIIVIVSPSGARHMYQAHFKD